MRADTREEHSNEILNLKAKIIKKDKRIANLKQDQTYLKENHQIFVCDLNAENVRQYQKIQQLTALVSDKEKCITGLKAEVSKMSTRIQQKETIVAAKEKTIFAMKVSNERSQNELNNARKLVDSLKKAKEKLMLSIKNKEDRAKFDRIRQVDQYFERYVFNDFNDNSNPVKPACDGVPYNGKTSSDESSKLNLRNLFVLAGVCYVAYKNPESLVRLSRIISFYSLLSLRKMFTCSIFLVDIPLNMLATKELFM